MADATETREIYNAVLQRDPTDAELAAFVAASQTPEEEAQQIDVLVNSTEARTDVYPFIQLYQAIFGRVPDEAGLNFWVDQLRAGVTLQTIVTGDPSRGIDGFANSAEFVAEYGANVDPNGEEFITALYRNFLRREPDQAGLEFYMGLGDDATVGDVVIAFTSSPEFESAIEAQIEVFLTKAANGTQDYLGSVYDTDDDGDVDDDDLGQAPFDVDLTDGTLTISGNAEATVVVDLSADPATVNGEALDGDVDTVDASELNDFGVNVTGSAAAETITGSAQADVIVSGGGADTIDAGDGDDIIGVGSSANVTGGGGNDEFHVTSETNAAVIADFSDGDEITFLDNGDNAGGSVDFANSEDGTAGAAGGDLDADDLDATANSIGEMDNGDGKVYVIQGAQTEAQIATEVNGATAANSYAVVYNSSSGMGEVWFDDDWSDIAGRSKVATLNGFTTLSAVVALEAADFGVYSTNEGGVEGPGAGGVEGTLTTGDDDLDGSDANDTFTGETDVSDNQIADTLNSGDDIDGGAGDMDIIRASAQDGAAPVINGVEVIFNTANTNLNLANTSGVMQVWDAAAGGGAGTAGVADAMLSMTFGSTGGGTFEIFFAPDEDFSGFNDGNNFDGEFEGPTVNLAVDDNDGAAADFDFFNGFVQNVNLAAMGDTGTGADDDVVMLDGNDNLETVTVTGAGDVDVTVTSTDFDLFDASAATGDVTASIVGGAGANAGTGAFDVVVRGGSGDDDLTANQAALMTGGDGEDTLTGSGFNDQLDGGAGADLLEGVGGNDVFVIDSDGVADDADIDVVAAAGSDFSTGAVDKIDFAGIDVAGSADNYDEEAVAVADYDAALVAANAAFGGDNDLVYFAVQDAGSGYLFADTDGDHEADEAVELVGNGVAILEDNGAYIIA